MRRFSKRNQLVTLSDLNVTPMLDLAFVLLIIFVIATPLLEQGMKLELPERVADDPGIDRGDICTVEVSREGAYLLDSAPMDDLAQLKVALEKAHQNNQDTIVYIRADALGFNKHTYSVIDTCRRIGLTKLSLRTKEGER